MVLLVMGETGHIFCQSITCGVTGFTNAHTAFRAMAVSAILHPGASLRTPTVAPRVMHQPRLLGVVPADDDYIMVDVG